MPHNLDGILTVQMHRCLALCQIVRNKILIDVQGGDILLQIFTCKILHRTAQQEAPFLEFIQRVCGSCTAAAGDSTFHRTPTTTNVHPFEPHSRTAHTVLMMAFSSLSQMALLTAPRHADGTCAPFKAGCGGFGVRNFLTLFLSIEVGIDEAIPCLTPKP